MNLLVNGTTIQADGGIETVQHLLDSYQLGNRVVIVEINGVILQKEEHGNTRLSNGDRVEIVSFVGGG